MNRVTPLQAPQLLNQIAPHLAGADARHRERFKSLMTLIAASADGEVQRLERTQTLYPGVTADSIKSDLATFKTALALAADKSGLGKLVLVSPKGRGGPNQLLWLEIEAHLQPAVPAATHLATTYIEQQISVAAHAVDLSPLQVAVSFAGVDQKLADALLAGVQVGLKARKSTLACRIHFWTFRSPLGDGIQGGQNDHQTIQEQFKRSVAGLLLVSPSACASQYIQEMEWPLFRTAAGKIIKPFLAVQLAPVWEGTHKLGVLDRSAKGDRTQLLHLHDDGQNLAWDDCLNKASQKRKFEEKLIDQLMDLIQASLPPPSTPPTGSTAPSPGKKPSPGAAKKKAQEAPQSSAALHRPCYLEADQQANVPGLGKSLGTLDAGPARQQSDHPKTPPESAIEAGVEIVPAMVHWACDPGDTPFAVLLGEYGMGKTWNSQLLAQALEKRIHNPSPGSGATPTPIYLDLRRAIEDNKALLSGDLPTLELFLDRLNARSAPAGQAAPTGKDTLQAVQQEGALLIFDGLDEVLAHNPDEAWGQQFINLLFSALPFSHWPPHLNKETASKNPGKLLLTCRTHYFKSTQTQNEQILGVGREQHRAAQPRAWQMLPFTKDQVLGYLQLHAPAQDPQVLFDLIASVHNLLEVSSRPQGLKMVCGQIGKLEQAKRDGTLVNGATIYAWMVQEWLNRDMGKHQLLQEDKATLMQDLALHLWQRGAREIQWAQLAKWFRAWLRLDPVRSATPQYQKATETTLLTDLRNATFLVRPGEDSFSFAHTSILEYFLALRLHRSLELDDIPAWEDLNPSPETLVFLHQHQLTCDDYTQNQACNTLRKHLARADTAGPAARLGLLALFERSPAEWALATLNISGLNLERHAFEGLQLETLVADGALLAESRWSHCRFKHSSWKHADGRQAQFDHLQGCHADFTDANLRASRWRQVAVDQIDLHRAQTQAMQTVGYRTQGSQPWTGHADSPLAAALPRGWHLQWTGHTSTITACALSTDGQTLLTASWDNTARLWNRQGECLRVLQGHESALIACALSADGHTLLTASYDKTARLWNRQGECLQVLQGHESTLNACALSADGHTVLTTSDDKTARLWSRQGECLQVLQGHESGLSACALSADGHTLLTASYDHTARLWNRQGECLLVLRGHEEGLSACALSADGHTLLTASWDNTARLWSRQGECLQVLRGREDIVTACALSADGSTLLTASQDDARLWNRQGECLLVLQGHEDILSACALSANGHTLLTASGDKTAQLWSRQGECLLVLQGHESKLNACALSVDGRTLLTASGDKTARLWNRQGECLQVLQGHESKLNACALSVDGHTVLTASDDKTARLWSRQGECLQVLQGHKRRLSACALSADGHTLMTASLDNTARLWNRQGECLQVLQGHERRLSACALSADGLTVLTAAWDHTARLWNRQGECLQVLQGHESRLSACALSADGHTLLTASHDHTARLWNRQGECLLVLRGHEGGLSACALSADGNILLTATHDTARLWNRQGECLQVLQGHDEGLIACVLSADGHTAITATAIQVRHWRRGTSDWACTLELRPTTQTRIWLDQATLTLRLDGPDWPYWQLQSSSPAVPGVEPVPKFLLGESIADMGPMAHEQLANADQWHFLPRDDIQVRNGREPKR
jgi:WD40 repeat protein